LKQWHHIVLLLLFPVIVYLAILGAVFFGQTALLFPAGQVGAPDPLPPGTQRVSLGAESGERLQGVHIPPAQAGEERLLVLGFGGNAWNAETMAGVLHDLYPAADVVAFHYRGYRPSAGAPSAAALIEDAPRVFDFARARTRPDRIVAVGFSIGCGVAASLAARRPLDGLILVTPFDSLTRVAAGHYRWLPVGLLFRHRMEPAHDLAGRRLPVAIIAAGRDTLIPAARTDGLRGALPNLAFDRTISEADHNSIYRDPGFDPAMRDALIQINSPSVMVD